MFYYLANLLARRFAFGVRARARARARARTLLLAEKPCQPNLKRFPRIAAAWVGTLIRSLLP